MFKTLAMSSDETAIRSTEGGKEALMFAASPRPVTRPMRAHMDWMADING